MKKIVFFTYEGLCLPIAYKLKKAGFTVYVGMAKNISEFNEEKIIKERRLSLYDNILDKEDADLLINSLLKVKNKEDYFIFFDFNYLWEYAERLKNKGFYGIFPTKNDRSFEVDRKKAIEFVEKKYEIFDKIKSYEFKKVDDGIEFLKNNQNTNFVLKGNNIDAQTIIPVSNIPQENHDEIIYYLLNYKKEYEKDGFILEEKIEDLIEFTPECISFDKKIIGVNIDLELKKFGPSNTGFNTGDSASFVMWIDFESKIYDYFLKPLEEKMLRENELTVWDASVLYSPSRNKFYFGEYCFNRFGWNSIFSEIITHDDIGEFFERLTEGKSLFTPQTKLFGSSIRIFKIYNGKDIKLQKEFPVFANIDNKNLFLWDVKKIDNQLVGVNYDENVAVVSFGDYDWKSAFKNCYDNINNLIRFSEMYYRSYQDIIDDSYINNLTTRYEFVKKIIEDGFPQLDK